MFESFVSNYCLIYQQALTHDAPRLALVVSLFLAFATLEFKFPAERGQTVAGRARNVGILALLILGGVFVSTAVFLYFPWKPQVRPDGGILKSAIMLLAYL